MTDMVALTIPAAGGVDSTALNWMTSPIRKDGVVLKGVDLGADSLAAISGQNDILVELNASHYLPARALGLVGLSEADVQVVNTSDADTVAICGTDDVTSVVTWNPLLSEIANMPESDVDAASDPWAATTLPTEH